jgi:predicted DNA binding CopG/RHH family protein
MDDLELDEEEKEILEAFESGKLVPVADKEAVVARLQSYADASLRKDRRVNIRITGHDLVALQNIALEEGIPYQTLMSSILHKYVTGRLIERPRSAPGQTTYAVHEERGAYNE